MNGLNIKKLLGGPHNMSTIMSALLYSIGSVHYRMLMLCALLC